VLTPHAFRHLGMPEPGRDAIQFPLFQGGEADE
jgi:Holliday junction DNA helicase RuvB